jgi:hypothetical protein
MLRPPSRWPPAHVRPGRPSLRWPQAEIKRRAESDKQLQAHFECELRGVQDRLGMQVMELHSTTKATTEGLSRTVQDLHSIVKCAPVSPPRSRRCACFTAAGVSLLLTCLFLAPASWRFLPGAPPAGACLLQRCRPAKLATPDGYFAARILTAHVLLDMSR